MNRKEKVLVWIIIILLITNILTFGYIFINKDKLLGKNGNFPSNQMDGNRPQGNPPDGFKGGNKNNSEDTTTNDSNTNNTDSNTTTTQ